MKNKIYRTVSVEERLPDGIDYTVVFEDGYLSSDTDVYSDGVVAWLEEIELPSEEDIIELAQKTSCVNQFWNGAYFILKHIKGGGK